MLNYVPFFLLVPQSLKEDSVICRAIIQALQDENVEYISLGNKSFQTVFSTYGKGMKASTLPVLVPCLQQYIFQFVFWFLFCFLLENRKIVKNKDSKCKDKNGMVLT